MAGYALSPPPILAPAASATAAPLPPPPHNKAAGSKRKRSQPGNPETPVIALSPRTLVATNRRFVCEICNKGFQREQNLQLHRRSHNLPWKLHQRGGSSSSSCLPSGEPAAPRKRVYVCPEPTCVRHDPARALGDLTGIKKYFSRHREKRWRCERCGKRYAVQSDWKAHVKGCGTREHRCNCGILFSRKDSLLTHRAFCDVLAEESARLLAAANNGRSITTTTSSSNTNDLLNTNNITPSLFLPFSNSPPVVAAQQNTNNSFLHQEQSPFLQPRMMMQQSSPYHLGLHIHVDSSITTTIGADSIPTDTPAVNLFGLTPTPDGSVATAVGHRRLTRDFLGVDVGGRHQVEELQLPLCATAAAASSRTASCATDLTARQYLGGRLPSLNETWSQGYSKLQ